MARTVLALVCALEPLGARLARVLRETGEIQVLGPVDSGGEALALHRSSKPDILVLDGDIDGCDGSRLGRVMLRERPVPILLLVSGGREAEARAALERDGAERVQVIQRRLALTMDRLSDHLVRSRTLLLGVERSAPNLGRSSPPPIGAVATLASRDFDAVVLLGSAGTPHMLPRLLSLPAYRPIPLVVAVHHNPRWSAAFASWVGSLAHTYPQPFQPFSRNDPSSPRLQVVQAGKEGSLCPDLGGVLTELLLQGHRLLVCLTSGMGEAALAELGAVRRADGVVFALEPSACSQPAMVDAAIQAGVTDAIVSLDECAWALANASMSGDAVDGSRSTSE